MVIIKLRGVLVDIICEISLDYKAYVTRYKRGVKQLMLRFQKSPYGKMVASLIYYLNLTKSLTITGFEINPYNQCFANKVIDSSQTTICFQVEQGK